MTKRVRLVLRTPARRLLAAKRSLKVPLTITSRTKTGAKTVRTAVVTLNLKRRR